MIYYITYFECMKLFCNLILRLKVDIIGVIILSQCRFCKKLIYVNLRSIQEKLCEDCLLIFTRKMVFRSKTIVDTANKSFIHSCSYLF